MVGTIYIDGLVEPMSVDDSLVDEVEKLDLEVFSIF